jgi:DNA-directed RNA polymerase I, II, and III subunit RPABC3
MVKSLTEVLSFLLQTISVSRILATSETKDVQLTLDVNTEIYPFSINDVFTFTLAKDDSLLQDYDYVMHGKVYKYDDSAGQRISFYCSFGGLLMCLSGDQRHLSAFNVGDSLYLYIRK